MPSSFSYILLFSPSPAPTGAVIPVFPAGGAGLTCNAVSFDQQHFLDLFDRVFPFDYMNPMKLNPNAGYERFQASALVGERVSTAIKRFECGSFLTFATGGSSAVVEIAFVRPTAAAGAVTIKAGTVVRTTRHNRRFVLLEDVVFGGADLGPIVGQAEAEAVGYDYNVPGLVVTSSGISLTGEVDDVEKFVLDPAYGDATLTVSQANPAAGGKSADLDGLGDNRGIARSASEGDDQYRLRLRTLPDVVSPDAMVRTIAARLSTARVPVEFDFCETFEHRYQEAYDAPSPNVGTPTYDGGSPPLNPDYNDTTFVYDDPRDVVLITDFCRNRLMDTIEYRGAFVVVVPNDITLIDVGLAYDDTGTQPSDFLNPFTGVRRGTPAYDIPHAADDNVIIMTAAYDGFDIERAALYAALFADLQKVKPAGVAAIIETLRD